MGCYKNITQLLLCYFCAGVASFCMCAMPKGVPQSCEWTVRKDAAYN